jgi:hypothetical protein
MMGAQSSIEGADKEPSRDYRNVAKLPLPQRDATGSANAVKVSPAVVTTHCRPSSM